MLDFCIESLWKMLSFSRAYSRWEVRIPDFKPRILNPNFNLVFVMWAIENNFIQ